MKKISKEYPLLPFQHAASAQMGWHSCSHRLSLHHFRWENSSHHFSIWYHVIMHVENQTIIQFTSQWEKIKNRNLKFNEKLIICQHILIECDHDTVIRINVTNSNNYWCNCWSPCSWFYAVAMAWFLDQRAVYYLDVPLYNISYSVYLPMFFESTNIF